MRGLLRHLPLALSALLAACATAPGPTPPPATPKPPQPAVVSRPPAPVSSLPTETTDVWQRLRHSFAMSDCDADPAITTWARRYTHNPQRFEAQLSAVLPRLAYVQQVAAQHGVPGEFVLLPWVESRFRPVSAHGKRPAGMWQIVPVTARSMGLQKTRGYDGRLDAAAATDAVMTMLQRYHDHFGDWRLVDYAYNAGEFAVRKLVRDHGIPSEAPPIPRLPVRRVTRQHLTKLLAIACVVRQPARFHVKLPSLPAGEELVLVRIDRHTSLAQVAAGTGMSTSELRALNAAFRKLADMPVAHLLLPRARAGQLRDASRESDTSSGRDDEPVGMAPGIKAGDSPG
jgi:membrane-bound lytic murein transglycosylase D